MRDSQTGLKFAAVAVPVVVVIGLLVRGCNPPPGPSPDPEIAAIESLLKANQWDDVITKCDEITAKYPSLTHRQVREVAVMRYEAERNKDLVPKGPETDEQTFPPGEPKVDAPLTAIFQQRYPAGRSIDSLAVMDIEGTGTNNRWIIQGSANFVLRWRAEGNTRVVSNDGNKAVFRIEMGEVSESLVYGEQTLEVKFPEGQLAEFVDRKATVYVPGYAQFKEAVLTAEYLDPGFTKTLKVAQQFAKAMGIDLSQPPPKDLEVLVELRRFSGQVLEVEFIRDIGITKIAVLNGQELPAELLTQFAHRSSLLLDYYIYPAEKKEVGDHWDVDTSDVAGLVAAGYNATTGGKLTLTRLADRAGDSSIARLSVSAKAPIDLAFEESDGSEVRVGLTPDASGGDTEVEYSTKDYLARRARVNWKVFLTRVPDNILLSGTSQIRATCKSYYDAKLAKESRVAE